mmetsp:Transcript_2087/g.6751  ORF Transcript_2087/g.6751 Transcript_2087/m.6751 type:complete len:205 (+) Transcript_2087:68-682(+)
MLSQPRISRAMMASSSRRRTISASAASAAASRRCRFASDSDRTSAVGYGISRLPGETAPLTAHGRGSEAAVVLPGSGETTIPTKTGDRSGERWPAAGGRSGDTMCSSANGSSTGGPKQSTIGSDDSAAARFWRLQAALPCSHSRLIPSSSASTSSHSGRAIGAGERRRLTRRDSRAHRRINSRGTSPARRWPKCLARSIAEPKG